MLRWWRELLRCRDRVAELERAVAELGDERRMLQVQSHERQCEIDRLREDLREALRAKDEAYKMMVNVSFQRQYGWIPHPDAPHLPEMRPPKSAGGVLEGSTAYEEIYRSRMEAAKQEFMELLVK